MLINQGQTRSRLCEKILPGAQRRCGDFFSKPEGPRLERFELIVYLCCAYLFYMHSPHVTLAGSMPDKELSSKAMHYMAQRQGLPWKSFLKHEKRLELKPAWLKKDNSDV